MKKIFSILSFLIAFSGISQEHSGGIVVPTGFKIAANAPVDDRFVVADSLSLYDLPNKYDGMFAVTLDEEKRVIWTYNEGEGVWSRVGVTNAKDVLFDNTESGLEAESVEGAIKEINDKVKLPFPLFTSIRKTSDTPLIEASESGWDNMLRENGNIIWDGEQYVMCYSGYIPPYSETSAVYIGIATSPTGEPGTWTKRGINGDGKAFDFNYGEDPYLIFKDGEYIIYYENKSIVPQTIAIASTTDLDGNWNNVTDEIIGLLPGYADDMDVSSPTLFYENDVLYMFYEYRKPSSITQTLDSRGTIYLAKSLDFGDTWEIVKEVVNSSNLTWSTSSVPDDVFKYGSYYFLLGHGELSFLYRPFFMFSTNLEDWSDFLQKPFDIDNESQTTRGGGITVYTNNNGILKVTYGSSTQIFEGVFNVSLMNSWIYRQQATFTGDFARLLRGVINGNRDEYIVFTQTQEQPYTPIRPDDNGGAGINKIIRNGSNFNFRLKPIDGVLLDGLDDEIVLIPNEYIHILSTGKNTYTLVSRGVQNPALVAYTNDYNDLDNKPNLELIPINIFNQYTESTVSGDDGANLIQPNLGIPILTPDDLKSGNSFKGEVVLNIDNNSVSTTKVITLFGAEIYNNTNPSADITAKITFTLDFFNQVGDDIDYKLSWEYLSSGEILFGEHSGTIDNTSNADFELLVTGHNTDSFNLKKANLWIIRDTRGRVLTTGTKWHPKLTKYYNNVIKSQGNSSSIKPYLNLINEKLIENDGQVMFLTYENTTSLALMIQTNSTQAWQVDWDGSGDWQTWNSLEIVRTKTFSIPTSGVAFIRSATGNSIEDINYVYSVTGNWNFDISALSTVSYYIRFSDSLMTLTGDISALSNVSYSVYFEGSSITLTGDISTLSNVSYRVFLIGNNMTLTYTTTTWETIPSNRLHLRLSSGRLTQSEVDQLFIDLNNAGTTGTAIIDLRGSNAAPSSASASARTALASRGYTVLHN